jgi:NadR type nicotinamide-nucleotide adenylyltransferase
MTLGLVLGKFAPLHRGHQLVLDAATHQTDNQVVVIYDSPSTTEIPLAVRARWIRQLYPLAEVIEAWGGPERVGLEPELMLEHERYLASVLGNRRVTHFFNSEPYGEHVATSLGAVNVQVDAARKSVPISATALRNEANLLPSFVSAEVLHDLVRKVVFIGAPSTGKSTIAEAAAKHLGTVYLPEYGREYWEKHAVDRRLTMRQLEEIAQTQLELEASLLASAHQTIFIDTDASTTAIFADYYHGRRSAALDNLAQRASQRYDLTFLCLNDFQFSDTEDRSGEANQIEFQRRIVENLRAERRPYIELGGSLTDRIRMVEQVVSSHKLFDNPGGWVTNG